MKKILSLAAAAMFLAGCCSAPSEVSAPTLSDTPDTTHTHPYTVTVKGRDGKVHKDCIVELEFYWSSVRCPDSYQHSDDDGPNSIDPSLPKASRDQYFYKGKWHQAKKATS